MLSNDRTQITIIKYVTKDNIKPKNTKCVLVFKYLYDNFDIK